MSRGLWLSVGLVLAVALGSAVFFQACEKRHATVPTGLRGEAASDRYLAARRLLEAMGAPTRSLATIEELDELPTPDGTLIIPADRSGFTEQRSLALLEWARAGGNLIVITWSLWDDADRVPDLLLDPLGVRQFMHEDSAEAGEELEAATSQVWWEDRDGPLEIVFDPLYYLELADREADWEVGDQHGIHLLSIREGAGRVTVATDDYFLANFTIADHDHAELLWRIAERGDAPVWLVRGVEYPSAWSLVWRHGAALVLSALALTALWAWASARRVGPIRPDDPVARRSLMEHVESTGRFQLHHRAERELLDATREALLERMRRRHPAWLGLPPNEQHARLARHSGMARERIDAALAFGEERDPERFWRRIATLEGIRRTL